MKLRRIASLFLIFAMLLSLPAFAADDHPTDGADETLNLISRILEREKLDGLLGIIETYSLYDYPGDDEILKSAIVEFFSRHPELFEEFANEMFATQDRYSHFMEPSTYESSYVLTDSFVGIGIQLDALLDGVVVAVIPGSPAEEVGMKAGDVLISADGVEFEDSYYKAIQGKLRGEEGTEVTVGVLRDGDKLEFTMTRRKVELSNIAFTDMGDGVAYIRIAHFGDMPDTFFDFVNTYSDLGDEGFTSVIFDVRDNGGGSLDTLLNILNYTFWESDLPMFSLRFRDEEPETYYSLGAGWEPETVVVLTNSNTASAAEMFAGALGYMAGAWIVGEDEYTYGKGVGQNHFELYDESVAVITSFEVLVGEDISYNGEGIPSDIVAPPDTIAAAYALDPLHTWLEMYPGARGDNVYALEQRLSLLGLTDSRLNGVLDGAEFDAINRFRRAHGLKLRDYVDFDTMEALNAAATEADVTVLHDAALDAALELCGIE